MGSDRGRSGATALRFGRTERWAPALALAVSVGWVVFDAVAFTHQGQPADSDAPSFPHELLWLLALQVPALLAVAALLRLAGRLRRAADVAAANARTLEETRWRFETLTRHLTEVLTISEAGSGRVLYASPSYVHLFGRPVEALYADPTDVLGAVHPEDRARFAAPRQGPDGTTDARYRVCHADGRVRWVHSRWRPVRGPGGQVTHVVGTSADVTESHEALEALRQSEVRFRTVMGATNDVVWDWDLTSDHLAWNAALHTVLGHVVAAESASGTWWRAHVHPGDRARVERGLDAVIDGAGERWEDEYRFQRGDGTWATVQTRGTVVREAGRAVRMLGALVDLSSRRTEQAALARRTADLRAIIAAFPDLYFWTDADGRILDFHAGRDAQLAMPAHAFLGKRATELFPGEQGERFHGAVQKALATGAPVAIEYTLDTPTGAHWFEARYVPVTGERAIAIIRDITERQAALEAARQSELQLRQSQKMEAVGRLAGGIAHDFNNLLSVILSMSHLVLEELPEGHALREDVHEVHRAAERAAGLTRQLLVFSRRQPEAPRLLDLNHVVREAEKLLRRALREDVLLALELAPEPLPVSADPGLLEQVLMNLVINARDAMPQGGTVTLQTEAVHLGAQAAREAGLSNAGDYLQLSVRDTGHGMSAAVQARIFDPFFTTKSEGEGTGLGLATVFGIVTQAHGSVGVESAEGRGSTFRVLLPRADVAPEALTTEVPPPPPRGSETLLLVEDERTVRAATRRILERAGYRVLEARHGADALRLWREEREAVSLVVTDLRMPELGGDALAAELAREAPFLPVLFLSGYAEWLPVLGDAPPPRALLQKPASNGALLEEVRRLLDLGAAAPVAAGRAR